MGGYMLGDKYNNLDTIHDFMYYNDQLKALSREPQSFGGMFIMMENIYIMPRILRLMAIGLTVLRKPMREFI
ncbi:hypothetical protein MGH68_02840 [Erysipelothrix sp. D19-032]